MKYSRACVFTALWFATLAHAADDGAAQSQALFRSRCGMCHLEGGFGSGVLARRLGQKKSLLENRDDLTALYVQQVVRNGFGSMPAFTKVELTQRELQVIARYLASRQRR